MDHPGLPKEMTGGDLRVPLTKQLHRQPNNKGEAIAASPCCLQLCSESQLPASHRSKYKKNS